MQYIDIVMKRPIALGPAMATALIAVVAGPAIALSAPSLQPGTFSHPGPCHGADRRRRRPNRSQPLQRGNRSVEIGRRQANLPQPIRRKAG